jgi:hypothetical protein
MKRGVSQHKQDMSFYERRPTKPLPTLSAPTFECIHPFDCGVLADPPADDRQLPNVPNTGAWYQLVD